MPPPGKPLTYGYRLTADAPMHALWGRSAYQKPVDLSGDASGRRNILGLFGGANRNILDMLFGGIPQGSFDLRGRARRAGEEGPAEMPGRWTGESTIPEGFQEPSPSPEEVIRAQEPRIQEALNKYAAQAAARLGQMGAHTGSGYAKTLGEQARRGTQDIAEITSKYKYQAAENAAQRALDAWRQKGGWEFAGDQGDLARSLQEHGMSGDWMMEKQRLERGRESQLQDLLFRIMSGG